jgi:hypothetical protein
MFVAAAGTKMRRSIHVDVAWRVPTDRVMLPSTTDETFELVVVRVIPIITFPVYVSFGEPSEIIRG